MRPTRSSYDTRYNWENRPGTSCFSAETRDLARHCRRDLSAYMSKVFSEVITGIHVIQKYQVMLSFCEWIQAGFPGKGKGDTAM